MKGVMFATRGENHAAGTYWGVDVDTRVHRYRPPPGMPKFLKTDIMKLEGMLWAAGRRLANVSLRVNGTRAQKSKKGELKVLDWVST
jgi:hypothetical protein